MNHLFGGLCALGSSLCWALSTLCFAALGKSLPPLLLNLGKGLTALLWFALFWPVFGSSQLPSEAMVPLGLSAILGLTIGDSAFFFSLAALGARKSVFISAMLPACTALGAYIWLGERLSALQLIGAAACVAGVVAVLNDRAENQTGTIPRKVYWFGVITGIIAVLACAASTLTSKRALALVSAYDASFFRLAVAYALLILPFGLPVRRRQLKLLTERKIFWGLMGTSFISTFVGIWLSMAGIKYTYASLSAILGGMSPLFVFILTALFYREPVTIQGVIGVLAAIGGSILCLL